MNTPIQQLERSYGNFPREHQFSAIEDLERGLDNPELDVFFGAAEKIVAQWTGDKFAGLYLYGEPGTGKTHAAIGLARTLHETGAAIHYRHIPSWRPNKRVVDGGFGDGRTEEIEPHIADWMGHVYASESELPKPFPTSRPVASARGYSTTYEEVHDKSILILDDYKPFARNYVASAIEAASQYGGLVVITSNYNDPFKILEETPEEKQKISRMDALTNLVPTDSAPSISSIANVMRGEQAAKRDALRSRVAASFKFIQFEGEDRRIKSSFWND
jgi:DNA polymerase III delta prime subunit